MTTSTTRVAALLTLLTILLWTPPAFGYSTNAEEDKDVPYGGSTLAHPDADEKAVFSSADGLRGGGQSECPAGYDLVAKFNWNEETELFEYEKGMGAAIVSISNVQTKPGEPKDPINAEFSSTTEIGAVRVKYGGNTVTDYYNPLVTSGSFDNNGEQNAISNVRFCAPPPPPPPDMDICEAAFDFEGFSAGTIVTTQISGVTISATGGSGQAMIFDSNCSGNACSGNDDDLATDPGYGPGNTTPQGNVLIISTDGNSASPNDHAGGGTLTFAFEASVYIGEVGLLDIDENTVDIVAYDAGGDAIGSPTTSVEAGDNSFQTVAVNKGGVHRLELIFSGSGAVTHIDLTCEADLSCAPQGAAGFIEWTNLSEEGQDPGPGDQVEFTLRFRNDGAATVSNATIQAYYPDPKFNYVSGGSNSTSGDLGIVSFTTGTLTPGDEETFAFTLQVDQSASGEGLVAAEVFAAPLPDPDSTPGNLNPTVEAGGILDADDNEDDSCTVPFNELPVELVAFDALVNGRAATLAWQTASETNNAGFEIQHRYLGQAGKTDGAFEVLSFVEGYGTTLEARHYSYAVHDLEPGRHVFRLRQIDYDGTAAYSPEVEIAVEMPEAFLVSPVYPNPFNPQASFSFGVHQAQAVTVRLYDVLGREVAELWRGHPAAGQTQTVMIDGSSLQSGTYFLRVEGERFVETQTVVLLK